MLLKQRVQVLGLIIGLLSANSYSLALAATTATSTSSPTTAEASNTNIESDDTYYDTGPTQNASYQQDPYEHFNQHMYAFNDTLDKILLKPVATVYRKVLPAPVTKGVSNFFTNIDTIPTIINDALQGKLFHLCADTTRFIVNSTLGVGGLFNIASYDPALTAHNEDFGLTLAYWGYKSSNYLVLPFFGPSTIRDTIGIPVDYGLFSVYTYLPPRVSYPMLGLYYLNRRAQLLDFDDVIKQAALDPYSFQRNAYLQYRAARIAANEEDNNDTTPQTDNYLAEQAKNLSSANTNIP